MTLAEDLAEVHLRIIQVPVSQGIRNSDAILVEEDRLREGRWRAADPLLRFQLLLGHLFGT